MDKARVRVGIVGVSGYSGIETARLVAAHPVLTLAAAVSDKWAGARLGDHLPVGGVAADVPVVKQADAAGSFAGLDLVFLCTPAEVSLALAPVALAAGCRVVDLSGGFRLAPALYPRWYGFEHPNPALLVTACY
jgi:N-acetyl-gamma-glutamyl-phosphate reductase